MADNHDFLYMVPTTTCSLPPFLCVSHGGGESPRKSAQTGEAPDNTLPCHCGDQHVKSHASWARSALADKRDRVSSAVIH
jgi:hypothetical protein